MPDREKVLKALEYHKETTVCNGCPYAGDEDTAQGFCPVYDDAIALLREQEPVKPKTVVRTGINKSPTVEALICGRCHKIIDHTGFNYCPYCGRKVKWDD